MPSQKSKYLRVGLGLVLTVVFLAIALHGIQLGQLLLAFREINLAWLGLSITLFAVNCFFRALMWRVTTRSFGRVDLSALFGGGRSRVPGQQPASPAGGRIGAGLLPDGAHRDCGDSQLFYDCY
jgi:hypothetical protein